MELKTLQKALEKETASAVAQSRASDAIGPLMGTMQRAMEEQGNALAPLMMQTVQSIARQFTEPMIATNAVSEMIRSISDEHQSMFARLHENTSADTSRWFAEAGIASSVFTEVINRSAAESWLSNASRLAQVVADVNKHSHEVFMPHASKMIADLNAQATSFNIVERVLAQQRADAKERLDIIQSSSRSHFAGTEDFFPALRSQLPRSIPPSGGAPDFMQRANEQFQEATAEAEETGGRVVAKCSLPGGEVISVSQLSLEDDYFVSVSGTDERGQRRSLKAHFNAVLITIEVVYPDETEEDDDDMPIN